MANYSIVWQNAHVLPATVYTCGFCGASVAPDKGWFGVRPQGGQRNATIYICHHCQGPTFIDPNGRRFPGIPFGEDVKDITDDGIATLYEEARRSSAASAYTAAVLCCRKVLMHVAVEKGAEPGKSFVSYVEHLATSGHIPPGAKEWVDHIRTKSNEANHEIVVMSSVDAEELLVHWDVVEGRLRVPGRDEEEGAAQPDFVMTRWPRELTERQSGAGYGRRAEVCRSGLSRDRTPVAARRRARRSGRRRASRLHLELVVGKHWRRFARPATLASSY
jgi:hypothetical protein